MAIKKIKLAGKTYEWEIKDFVLANGESVMHRIVRTDIGIYEYKQNRMHPILFYKQQGAWGAFNSDEKEIKNEDGLNREVIRMYNENRPFYT